MKATGSKRLRTDLYSSRPFIKFYFYASLAGVYSASLSQMQKAICLRYHITPQEFVLLLEERAARWSLKIEKAEQLFSSSCLADELMHQLQRNSRSLVMSEGAVRSLIGVYLCLVLQNVSTLTFENHLRKKDVLLLLELLESEEHLRPCCKELFRPIRQAARRSVSPASETYLLRMMAYIQVLSWYYTDFIRHHTGRMELARQLIQNIKHLQLQELKDLIGPPSKETHLSFPSYPADF